MQWLKGLLVQRTAYWPVISFDGYGSETWGDPEEILNTFWAVSFMRKKDLSKGSFESRDRSIYSLQPVALNGKLLLTNKDIVDLNNDDLKNASIVTELYPNYGFGNETVYKVSVR